MKFRTEIILPDYPFQISHEDSIIFMGSCFSDHIGAFFKRSGFHTLLNPFGVLFNPLSIALALRLAINPDKFNHSFIDHFNGFWLSFAHHGQFSHTDKTVFLQNIEDQLRLTHDFLEKADFLFITFGTAYYYHHIKKNLTVSNCHKIPAFEFDKRRAEVEGVISDYHDLFQELFQLNPSLKIVFTVSPIRHLADGFHENQLSKSILHLTVDKLVEGKTFFYFPSYEILQDDLRDYRFYAHDLCHPAENAVEYIREKVSETFFSKETILKIKEIEKEEKRKGHIPIK